MKDNTITYRRLQFFLMNMNDDELDQPVRVFIQQHNQYVDITNFKFKKTDKTSAKPCYKLTLVAEDPEKHHLSSCKSFPKNDKPNTSSPFTVGNGDGDYFIWDAE